MCVYVCVCVCVCVSVCHWVASPPIPRHSILTAARQAGSDEITRPGQFSFNHEAGVVAVDC